jgi:hypothetical protein
MKYALTLVLAVACCVASAQYPKLATDNSIVIPTLQFDAAGALVIKASATSSTRDFDFLVGKWKMHHRRLNKRLEGCKDWTEFDSWDDDSTVLSGTANLDTYRTTEMPGMEGKAFEGMTLRLFNPQTKLWSIYWVASDRGVLDPPMVGSFENGIGHFLARDNYHGKNVIVLFRWDIRNKEHAVWSQAFSPDEGKTWEWNWYNSFVRVN